MDVARQSPTPTPTLAQAYLLIKNAAYEGNFYYTFGVGTQLQLVQDLGEHLILKTGNVELDVPRDLVTTDVAIARQAWIAEDARQKQQLARGRTLTVRLGIFFMSVCLVAIRLRVA